MPVNSLAYTFTSNIIAEAVIAMVVAVTVMACGRHCIGLHRLPRLKTLESKRSVMPVQLYGIVCQHPSRHQHRSAGS